MSNASRTTAAEAARALQARQTARSAGLVYVSDEEPGIVRRRAGKGQLPDARRPACARRADPAAHPPAGHPAGLQRGVDLHQAE